MLVIAPFVFTLLAASSVSAAPVPKPVEVLEKRIDLPANFGKKIAAAILAGIAGGGVYTLLDKPIKELFGIPTSTTTAVAAPAATSYSYDSYAAAPAAAAAAKRGFASELGTVFVDAAKAIGPKTAAKEAAIGAGMGIGMMGLFGVLSHMVGGGSSDSTAVTTTDATTEAAAPASRRSFDYVAIGEDLLHFLKTPLEAAKQDSSPAAKILVGAGSSVVMLGGGVAIVEATKNTSLASYFPSSILKRSTLFVKDETTIEKRVNWTAAIDWIATGAAGLVAALGANYAVGKVMNIGSGSGKTVTEESSSADASSAPVSSASTGSTFRRHLSEEAVYAELD